MPPDNAAYFQAAYIITIVLYVGYYVSLRLRARSIAARAAAAHSARGHTGADAVTAPAGEHA